MKTVQTCIDQIEKFAPPSLAEFDYVGLLHGDSQHPVKKVALTLDYTLQAIQQAIDAGCDLLITHHGPTEISYPLTGNNLAKIQLASLHGLSVYRCHLNLDFCSGGIIDTLCELLQIPAQKQRLMYKGKSLYGGVNLAPKHPMTLDEIQERVKVLDGVSVRIAGKQRSHFSRIAITSGQGFISEFFDQLKPDLYIAGEFEQEATKYAEDLGITLVELGHHQSEQRTLPIIAKRFEALFKIPVVPIEVVDTIRTVFLKKEEVC